MKSIANFSNYSQRLPLVADNILEFHAARLLLLFHICGRSGRIAGLTKMAKLDFFVRYPEFFRRACTTLGIEIPTTTDHVEAAMVRYHYGPWDQRYYHVLAYLESRGLIEVEKSGKSFNLTLTKLGKNIAQELTKEQVFQELIHHMEQVNKVFGGKGGSQLKNLIYEIFDKEVGQLSLQEVIE